MTLTVGLRFRRHDTAGLRFLTDRAETSDLRDAADLFRKAADAAHKGEPLILACDSLDEAKRVAAGFVVYGVTEPNIEQVFDDAA